MSLARTTDAEPAVNVTSAEEPRLAIRVAHSAGERRDALGTRNLGRTTRCSMSATLSDRQETSTDPVIRGSP